MKIIRIALITETYKILSKLNFKTTLPGIYALI